MALKFLKENGYPCDLIIESIEGDRHDKDPLHEVFVNGKKIAWFRCKLYDRRLYVQGFFDGWKLGKCEKI